MNIEIHPHILQGQLRAIASKSQGHRCMIAAALSNEPTTIRISSFSKDIEATLNVIDALGAVSTQISEDVLKIDPIGKPQATAFLNCGESGSTLRFLFPVAAALGGREYTFTGGGKLPERPMDPLLREVRQKGITVKGEKLPLKIGGKLKPGKFTLPGDISSQFISGLLFALPLLEGDSEIEITTPTQSKAYIDMTLDTLKLFGVKIEEEKNGYFIKGAQTYKSPGFIEVEGDWSNAAFWFTAGALGGPVTLTGLDLDSSQGDKKILDILKTMGAEVEAAPEAITVRKGKLQGCEIDAGEIPDLVPILSVAAAAAEGATVIKNARRLRIKECDRLFAMEQLLSLLGVEVQGTEDGLIIKGGVIDGGKTDSFNDHRIAMSGAIASVVAKGPIIITGAEAVDKSYPGFFKDLQRLGGLANVLYLR
ncbi:MAG: 3-phosphoshikimate 1-carboxyvinyltransferase [Bacillota bacterium]|nr:3-phosphoshikimate 1-carboxyvinyltransferase [Bacillota bacterium]